MLSPVEGHWQEEVSLPQSPNQCQSKHIGTELSYVMSTVLWRREACSQQFLSGKGRRGKATVP